MNRTILDKKVSIEAFEWYDEIRKGYFSIREIIASTEPRIPYEQRAGIDFPALRPVLRGLVDDVRTEIMNNNSL